MVVARRRILLWPHIAAVSLAVRAIARLGPRRSSSILQRLSRRPMPPMAVDDLVARVDWVIRRSRTFVRGDCLVRGMTLYYFLARMRLPVRLEFGVGDVAGNVEGHCWLVMGGEPIFERRDPREVFRQIFSIPTGTME